jgi:Uma2 family endonuclease
MPIPEVKPAIESIRGRFEQKVSPRRRHAILQLRIGALLAQWAGNRGEVGTEWRFYISPPGEVASSLVPDVAFVSFERLPLELGEAREKPGIAPDIAVAILSPGDRPSLLEEKIAIYTANGCRAVVVVDPTAKEVRVCGSLDAFPGLRIDTEKLFENV